jgi:hypothetical protein
MNRNTTTDNIVTLNNAVFENSVVVISHVANSATAATVSLSKPFLDISKIKVITRENFKRW